VVMKSLASADSAESSTAAAAMTMTMTSPVAAGRKVAAMVAATTRAQVATERRATVVGTKV